MKYLLLPLAVILLSCVCQALEEGCHVWIIKTDPKTAASITSALAKDDLSSDKIDETITKLIKGRKVEEIARCRAENAITERQTFDELTDVFSIRGVGELNQLGRFLNMENHLNTAKGLCSSHLHSTSLTKLDSYKLKHVETNSAFTFQANKWSLANFSREEDSTTLTLINAVTNQANQQTINTPSQETYTFELHEVSSSDITKFNKSTPSTRQKAIKWLKSRGSEIYAHKLTSQAGERSQHENRVNWFYEDAGSYTTAQMGYIAYIRSLQTSHDRGSLFLWTKVEWTIPDKPKEKPDYDFRIKSKFNSNETKVFFPTILNNDADKRLALFITATISGPKNKAPTNYGRSSSTQKYTHQYIVPVDFLNTLRERQDKKNPQPGKDSWERGLNPVRVKQLLSSEGIDFPEKTNVMFSSRDSIVTLFHSKEAHDAFKKLLESF
ncbi:hypothetical protein Rhal01_01807 [Rubritalea halochordaticola]|uniref:Uncharacterized protein n=1 Tax=Rubritalea halochordaticola TaxID=714537 RepID=A0ABP9UZI4_9BACT